MDQPRLFRPHLGTNWCIALARRCRGRDAATWAGLRGTSSRAPPPRAFPAIQRKEAQWWRDASIAYFQTFSRLPLPEGEAPPEHPLEYYKALEFPHAPGDTQ